MSELAVTTQDGVVMLALSDPQPVTLLSPETARSASEQLARAAYKARYGKEAPSDLALVADQIRARVNQQTRDRLVARIALILPSLQDRGKTPGFIAMELVDRILSDVT